MGMCQETTKLLDSIIFQYFCGFDVNRLQTFTNHEAPVIVNISISLFLITTISCHYQLVFKKIEIQSLSEPRVFVFGLVSRKSLHVCVCLPSLPRP